MGNAKPLSNSFRYLNVPPGISGAAVAGSPRASAETRRAGVGARRWPTVRRAVRRFPGIFCLLGTRPLGVVARLQSK
jgi:hypothetical protein